MSGLKVLIVGASIAGPTTAYWLAKAGARVTVIERFPQLRSNGHAVDIRTAGVSVMRKMAGMEAEVRAKSTTEEGVSFVREDGRPYGVIGTTGNPDQQSLLSEFEIFRGDLSKILFDLTKDNKNIRYIFGEQVASMEQENTDNGRINVKFANGLPSSEYDLVVACDGATSRTRAMAFGCDVREYIVPTALWTAYFSIEQDLLQGSRVGQGYSAIGGRTISIGPDPAGGTRVMLMAVQQHNKPETTLTFREASLRGEDALKQYITRHYRGVGWKTEFLMQEMLDAKDFYASEIVQVKVPRLYNGRLVMVGDAGYAAGPTGGGTSLALAGAYMLAGEILKHPGDLSAGLAGYEKQMRPMIKELQKIPPLVATIIAPQTAWGIWIRNYTFAFIAWTGIAGFFQKYLGGAFASTDSFPLPDYKWIK